MNVDELVPVDPEHGIYARRVKDPYYGIADNSPREYQFEHVYVPGDYEYEYLPEGVEQLLDEKWDTWYVAKLVERQHNARRNINE